MREGKTMQKTQRTFTREFKMEAVQLLHMSEKPLAQIARDLGIAESTLHNWRKLFSKQGEQAFPGSGHQSPQEEEIRHLFARPAVKFQFIAEHSQQYSITLLCQALEVSESGYYAWKHREVSQHCREDARLSAEIQQIFLEHAAVYGSPRIHAVLQARGTHCSRKRVARLMQQLGLSAQSKRSRKPTRHERPSRTLCTQSAQSRV
jgi:HTH-like domain/Transposase